jgi:hypothetical protein
MVTTKVSIRFTSLNNLWAFRLEIDANEFAMNLAELTITCECSKEHLELAKSKYHARVVELVKDTA